MATKQIKINHTKTLYTVLVKLDQKTGNWEATYNQLYFEQQYGPVTCGLHATMLSKVQSMMMKNFKIWLEIWNRGPLKLTTYTIRNILAIQLNFYWKP